MEDQKWKLKRTKQCQKCPWKVSTDPTDIPGYLQTSHLDLFDTVASDPNDVCKRSMACHESKEGKEYYCIGWFANQIGPGNNVRLRLKALNCSNLNDIELDGEQHGSFEETLPRMKP